MVQVPPILIQMLREKALCDKYDLRSLRYMFSGAAPLGEETIQALMREFPDLTIGQAYGELSQASDGTWY